MWLNWRKLTWKTPTPLLDRVYLGCNQWQGQTIEKGMKEKQEFFAERISTDTDTKIENESKENIEAWSYNMELHAHECVERFCELAQKSINQLHKVSTPNQQIKVEDMESVGELSERWSQTVLKCLHIARIGRLDLLWTVCNLARSVRK